MGFVYHQHPRQESRWAREFGTTRPAMASSSAALPDSNCTYNGMTIHASRAVGSIYASRCEPMACLRKLPALIRLLATWPSRPREEAASYRRVKTKELPLAAKTSRALPTASSMASGYARHDHVLPDNPIFPRPMRISGGALKKVFPARPRPFRARPRCSRPLRRPTYSIVETPRYPSGLAPDQPARAGGKAAPTPSISSTRCRDRQAHQLPMSEYYKSSHVENVSMRSPRASRRTPRQRRDSLGPGLPWCLVSQADPYRQIAASFAVGRRGLLYRSRRAVKEICSLPTRASSIEFALPCALRGLRLRKDGIAKERVGFHSTSRPRTTASATCTSSHHDPCTSRGHGQHPAPSRSTSGPGGRKRCPGYHPRRRRLAAPHGDRLKISNELGAIYARRHIFPAMRPEHVAMPTAWPLRAWRWAASRNSGNVNEILPNVAEPISNASLCPR